MCKKTVLRFTTPAILAGVFFICLGPAALNCACADGKAFSSTIQPRQEITVFEDGQEVAVYHSGPAIDKPYFHPIWTPDRRVITYDAPADHIHHRGLSFGWADVSGYDFWGEIYAAKGKRGFMIPRTTETENLPGGGMKIVETADWKGEDGTLVLEDTHVWTFYPAEGNLRIIDTDIELRPVLDEVIFGSEAYTDKKSPRIYHGLTFRLGPFENPRFTNSEGGVGYEACHGKAARWCALSGLQAGRPVTAAILDHPQNDVHPTSFFVLGRGMQFISSSPNFYKPKHLEKGETWRLRYRIIAAGAPLQDGADGWDLERLWREYARRKE